MMPSGLKNSMKHEGTGDQDILCRYLLSLKAYLSLKKVNLFTVRESYQIYLFIFFKEVENQNI